MSLPSPLELVARLADDDATELANLLGDLARAGRAGYVVPGRVVDGQATTVNRVASPWDAPAGDRTLELLDQLATAGTRQARLGATSGGKTAEPAHARPLPYVASPLELLGQLAGLLASWATATHRRDLEEWDLVAKAAADAGREAPPAPAGPPSLHADACAAWLLSRLPVLVRRPGTTSLELAVLRRLVGRARAMVDRPADRFYAGPCATPLRDADSSLVIVDGEQAYCEEDLYARPGLPVVVCRACTAHHRVEARRTELLRLARNRELNAVDMSRALTALGTPVTDARLRQWKRRELLAVVGLDAKGRPLYRVGDVMDLLVADAGRAAKRPPRKARAA